MIEKVLSGVTHEKAAVIFGSFDSYLMLLENEFSVKLSMCSDGVKIVGETTECVENAFSAVEYLARIASYSDSYTD